MSTNVTSETALPASQNVRAIEFGSAYEKWLEARTMEAKLNASVSAGYNPDAETDRILEFVRAAEHRLTFCPAGLPYQVVQKFEVLETMITVRERDGCPFDNRHLMMLSSVRADLYHLQHQAEMGLIGE